MSFTESEAVGTTEVESPEATTDAGIEAEAPEVVEAPPAEAPQTFSIKVDGQEQEVTLDELRNGYQRQQDYTRKTQEIAAERQRVQQFDALAYALQSDPQGTLAELAKELGVDLGGNQEQLDPEEQRWRNVEQFIESQQRQQQESAANARAQAQIDHELQTLQGRVGEFDHQELIQYAVEHQIPVLDEAYKAMQYEAVMAERETQKQAVTAAKRQDAVVEGGAARQPKAVVPGGSNKPSVREAYRQAVAAVGN